jgi:hypothetical protein
MSEGQIATRETIFLFPVLILLAGFLFAFSSPALANDDPPGRVARLNYIQGSISFQNRKRTAETGGARAGIKKAERRKRPKVNLLNLNSEVEVGTWDGNPGTPISRLAVCKTPFRRMAFPGSPPSTVKAGAN